MSMADSAGTDTHRMCTHVRASRSPSRPRSLIPCSPCLPLVPFRCPDYPPPLFCVCTCSRKRQMRTRVVSLTFEHSSSSRSRPQRNPPLSRHLAHPFSHPTTLPTVTSHPLSFFCMSPTKASIYPVLRVSLRVLIFFLHCSSSSDEFNG